MNKEKTQQPSQDIGLSRPSDYVVPAKCNQSDLLHDSLAVVVQNIQLIKQRLSPKLQANREVAEVEGFTMEQLQRYLEQRHINQFFDAVQSAGKRLNTLMSSIVEK